MFRLTNLNAQGRPMMNKTLATLLLVSAAATFSACSDKDAASTAPEAEAPVTEPAVVVEPEVTTEEPVVEEVPAEEPAAEAPMEESMPAEETAATAPEVELSADAGKVLYEKQCKTCHEAGLLEAPKYGNKDAWAPHIAKGKATLYEHSAQGFNKMPAQAVNGVTEAEVHAAVDYMLASVS